MNLTADKAAELEKNFIENDLMSQGDHIIENIKGDYWEGFLIFQSQTRGAYYFTNERVIFVGGFAGSYSWSLSYKDIKKIDKCLIGLFPFGIKLTYYNEEKCKDKKHKMSVLSRSKWIEFLNARTNTSAE